MKSVKGAIKQTQRPSGLYSQPITWSWEQSANE